MSLQPNLHTLIQVECLRYLAETSQGSAATSRITLTVRNRIRAAAIHRHVSEKAIRRQLHLLRADGLVEPAYHSTNGSVLGWHITLAGRSASSASDMSCLVDKIISSARAAP